MEHEARARVDVWNYLLGFNALRVVKSAIELGIPEALETPMTLSELSLAVDCPETALYRILRFLTHRGIFRKEITSEVRYVQTPLSRLLSVDGMGPFMLVQACPIPVYSRENLKAGRGSGVNPPSTESKMWTPEAFPELGKMFPDFLGCHAKATTSAVINQCPETFAGITSLVDVGGHKGTALAMLVKAFPSIRGINFDLPNMVSGAAPLDGVEHVAGNMFENIPKADAVMLMWILHDWSDELCIEILRKSKEAIPADSGKVIIIDAVLDDEEESRDEYTDARLAMDMTIMVATVNGKERTSREWAQLIRAAGYTRHVIKHMDAIDSVIELYP